MPVNAYLVPLKSGEFRIRLRATGCQEQYRRVPGPREAAQRVADTWVAEIANQGANPVSAGTTLRSFALAQLEDKGLRPQTTRAYSRIIRLYFGDLGEKPLHRITTQDGRAWLIDARTKGWAEYSTAYAYRYMHQVMRDAVRLGVLPLDPWARLPARRPTSPPIDLPDITKMTFLETGGLTAGDKVKLLVALALSTGARRSELLALRWRDIDLDKRSLRIAGQLCQKDGKYVIEPPKSAKGRRTITLPAEMVTVLAQARALAEERVALERRAVGPQPVFVNAEGSDFWNPNAAGRDVVLHFRDLGLHDATLHTLRHMHASMLLSARINPRLVQERLGHSDVKQTLAIYGHVMPQDDEEAADTIGRWLASGRPPVRRKAPTETVEPPPLADDAEAA